ncbi:MAG: N-acetylornithine carbamoyltransferase [Planctomycetota bacterium]
MTKRDLLSSADLSPAELQELLDQAERQRGAAPGAALAGKTLGLLFFDRSLRTRVSFEVAMDQLGGHCMNIFADRELYDLEPDEQVVMDGAAEEHVKDAARTLSRYLHALGVRQISQSGQWDVDRQDLLIRAYAQHASIPVINLETVQEHPCQAIADILTIRQNLGELRGRKITLAWANHPKPKGMGASHSILTLASMLGMDVTVAHPLGFELDGEVMRRATERAGASGGGVRVVNDLAEAVRGTQVLYARSWGSVKYWADPEREAMVKRSLNSWQVDEATMGRTDNALFMHPLPVRRNVAVTDDVLDGPRSVIYDQAENRVHVQKALLLRLLADA